MDESQNQGDNPPAKRGGEQASSRKNQPPFWKRRPVVIVGTVALAGLFFLGLHYLAESFTHESTDDAFLDANIVALAPRVAGQVEKVSVTDNQPVKTGDLLVEIDPRDFEVQLAQKKAAQAAAEDNVKLLESSIELLKTQVDSAKATANQSEDEAEADQATAERANADLKRAENLIQNQTISSQEYDAAKAAAAAAAAMLKAGREKAASDRAKIAETEAQLQAGFRAWERTQAQAKQSGVDVQQAELNLSYTRITAPVDGRVTRKAVEEGDYVQIGQRLMALVPNEVWVTANFKETQLKRIRPRQLADIRIDSVAGGTFTGRVDSIQAGSGAAFSLLPPENAVGNFVKVVQRVPVKIVFERSIETSHALGPGMSVVPSVKVTSYEIPDLAVALAAGVLAVLVGFLWWRAANRPPQASS